MHPMRRPAARNKTFDVCYEVMADESASMYELVSSAPDKLRAESYLSEASCKLLYLCLFLCFSCVRCQTSRKRLNN